MNIEIRGDGAFVSGYINVTEKKSRPVMTAHGLVIEEIEPQAFERALGRANNITMTKDHDPGTVLAETKSGTLTLYEDHIGLYAQAKITDPKTVWELRNKKAKGWSFGMCHVEDELIRREGELPLRKVKNLDLDHISLIIQKNPVYPATSLEVRAGDEEDETKEEIRRFSMTERAKEIRQRGFFIRLLALCRLQYGFPHDIIESRGDYLKKPNGQLNGSRPGARKAIGKNGGTLRAEDMPEIRSSKGRYRLVPGTKVTGIYNFAGKGSNPLRVEDHLIRQYGGEKGSWQHTAGNGIMDFGNGPQKVHIHWFQEPSVGIVGAKIKEGD